MNWLTTSSSPAVCRTSRFITPAFVVEDAQARGFARQIVDVLLRIGLLDADEQQQSRSDRRMECAVDRDRGAADALDQQAHGSERYGRRKAQRLSPAGTGAVMLHRLPTDGMRESIAREWSEMPPSGFERRAPYFKSPLIGQPIFESWARIW